MTLSTARDTGPETAAVSSAHRTFLTERAGLDAMNAALDGPLGAAFQAVVDRILAARGRVIVTGMGKSGHIGRKIAATLASTGTPAYFVHPGEASHGDLGMVTPDDVVVALSWSGETRELGDTIDYAARFNVTLVAVTCNAASTLGRAADLVLELPKTQEACPHGLAPTTSSLMQLALGDALAIALLEGRGFTPLDFRVYHPGGKLGAALRFVRDVMHSENMPVVDSGTLLTQAVMVMSRCRFGCVGVINDAGGLIGIATDGDLGRKLTPEAFGRPVDEIMTPGPKVIRPDALVSEALELMERHRIGALFVMEGSRPVGIVHMLDLLNIGLV